MEPDWELMKKLVRDVPYGLIRSKERKYVPPEVKEGVRERDKVCRMCGRSKNTVIHHIVPTGESNPENLILLCRRCHNVIHELLAITKRWRDVSIPQINRGMGFRR